MYSQSECINDDLVYGYDGEYQDKFTEVYLTTYGSIYRETYDRDLQDSLSVGCSTSEADNRARASATEQAHSWLPAPGKQ